jgi:hypothetical protein
MATVSYFIATMLASQQIMLGKADVGFTSTLTS